MVYNRKSTEILLKWMIWGYPYFRKPPFEHDGAEPFVAANLQRTRVRRCAASAEAVCSSIPICQSSTSSVTIGCFSVWRDVLYLDLVWSCPHSPKVLVELLPSPKSVCPVGCQVDLQICRGRSTIPPQCDIMFATGCILDGLFLSQRALLQEFSKPKLYW